MELIQTARHQLKKKVDFAVNTVGPKLFPNFDKLRNIAKDPRSYRKRYDEKQLIKKSSSNLNFKQSLAAKSSRDNLRADARYRPHHAASVRDLVDQNPSMYSSRRQSFDELQSVTDYDLDYQEELELNKAFNVFKDI